MIISKKHNFIFIHIHKTGGESIVAALEPDLGENDWTTSSGARAWLQTHSRSQFRSFRTLRKHSRACAVRNVVPASLWDNYFKFAFVRHPVDRAISMYDFTSRMIGERESWWWRQRLWLSTPPGRRGDPRRWVVTKAFLETKSFTEFIRHPLVQQDPGMQPQSKFVYDDDGHLMVDFVGRFEHLREDFRSILQSLRLSPREIPWKNRSNLKTSRTIASRDDCVFLQSIFREDFDRFHYKLL